MSEQKKILIVDDEPDLLAIWKDETFVEPRTVDVHIRRLRAQIEDDPAAPVTIKTRRGIGCYAE
jgi:DNA-binding response OmpR family regulator